MPPDAVDDADAQTEKMIDLAHPGGIAARQIVVDGHDVHALAGQGVEIGGQRGHQGLALAGAHLGDLAVVQHHAADQLHVEVAHAEHALARPRGPRRRSPAAGRRTRVSGIENVPSGRVLLVANHSGQLPFDAINIHAAMFFNANPPRVVRAMVDRFVPTLPHVGVCFARWGQVLGTSDNCLRLLHDEEAILVFPEGARGIAKPITERYMLKPFGLGFIRLAIETNTPIVPVAVVGAEEQAPAFNVAPLARLINAPAFPIMPFPPFVPILPLPTRYHLLFGEPRQLSGDADDEDEAIAELARQVRLSIESLIRIGRKQRRSIFR
jgi:1-acyl-sn-glycerol-3-phosphate acyltransferase